MRRFFVEIAEVAFGRLQELALRERRDVRSQAALLLEDAIASLPSDGECPGQRAGDGAVPGQGGWSHSQAASQ